MKAKAGMNMVKTLLLIGLIAIVLLVSYQAYASQSLAIGLQAPDFQLYGDDGMLHNLSDYRGKKVVLYFYPKNFTPGCTKQACSLRDDYSLFAKNEIVVIGVSNDSVESHKKFKEKYNLPFILLSDPQSTVFKLYGAKGFFINDRVTYLIDETGRITKIFKKVSPATHARDILQELGITSY